MTKEKLKANDYLKAFILSGDGIERMMEKEESGRQTEKYGAKLDLVLEASQMKLLNENTGYSNTFVMLSFGLLLGGISGVCLARGDIELGVVGSIMAVAIIENAMLKQ